MVSTRKKITTARKNELVIDGDVKLDLTITMENLAKMVRTDARDILTGQYSKAKRNLDDANDAYCQLHKQLESLAEQCGAEASITEAVELASRLSAFTDTPYAATRSTVTCNVDENRVSVVVVVAPAKKPSGYGYNDEPEIRKTIEVNFTPAMKTIVSRLGEATATIDKLKKDLDAARQQLADLPNMIDRAESAMMKAYLANKLQTGSDLLQLLGTVKPATPLLTQD
jgi:hypothetical protein